MWYFKDTSWECVEDITSEEDVENGISTVVVTGLNHRTREIIDGIAIFQGGLLLNISVNKKTK
jgi:hypothetical protein